MINLVQLQPEYRFDTKDIDPYCDMDLEECGRHVRKEIKTIIEKWNVQPNPERDAKGKVPRNRQTPYWCSYRDVFIRNGFQSEDISTLRSEVNQALEKVIECKVDAIEELKKMPQVDNLNCIIASPPKVIRFLEELIEQLKRDQDYVNQHLGRVLKTDFIMIIWGRDELGSAS